MKFKVKTLFLSLIGLAVMFGISVNANASSTTLLNLEFPSSNSATTSLTIGGWAMSLEENTRIRIYFNGEELNDITRSSRADVLNAIKGYGDATTNPNPGFKKELDLTTYKDGKYNLVVQVVNENNRVLEEVAKVITINKYVSLMTVEEPSSSVVGTNLTIGGWVMSTNKDALVQVFLDGVEIEGVNRTTRADVIKAIKDYGDAATNPTPGFKVHYDVSAFTDGKHNLEVRLYDPNSNEIMAQYKNTITLEKYKYKINLENPASTSISGTDLKIGGWLMASSPSIVVKAFIDNEELSDFTRIERADVLKAITGYGDTTVNPTPGFEQTVNLSSLDDGKHTLKVKVTNVVFMGQGEPLLNLENILKAISIFNEDFKIGKRRITVSTCGVVPGIENLAKLDFQCTLAVSLHAVSNDLRNKLMPINKKYPIEVLIDSLQNFVQKTSKRVTIEYVLLGGVNDSVEDAKNLFLLIKNLKCNINLIPYNPCENDQFSRPKSIDIQKFKYILEQSSKKVTLRLERGKDIDAACGQLSGKFNKKISPC